MNETENLSIYHHAKFLLQWDLRERAKKVCEGLVTISPQFALGWSLLSEIYESGDKSLDYIRRAYQLDPENMAICMAYCRSEIDSGSVKNAKVALQKICIREDFWGQRAQLMLKRI